MSSASFGARFARRAAPASSSRRSGSCRADRAAPPACSAARIVVPPARRHAECSRRDPPAWRRRTTRPRARRAPCRRRCGIPPGARRLLARQQVMRGRLRRGRPRRRGLGCRGRARRTRARPRRIERPRQLLERLGQQLGQPRRRIDRLARAERPIQRRAIFVVGSVHDRPAFHISHDRRRERRAARPSCSRRTRNSRARASRP